MATQPLAKSLPSNFAEMVLQLEMDLTYQCSLTRINQLISLYSEGIEYFECLGDPRFL
jgi:hypothetical protein